MLVKLWVKYCIFNIHSVKEDHCNIFFNVFTNIFQHFTIVLTNFEKSPFFTIFSNFSTFTTILNNIFTIFPNFEK